MICPCGECPRNVATASWQCTSLFLATNSNFLGQTQHSCGSTGSLLSWHGSLRFLAVPPPENAAERDSICVMRRHYTEHDGQAVLHSQRGIPEMLRKMAEPLGEACSVTRRLLRRGLGLQTSRRVNIFFPAKGRILFEQPSYTKKFCPVQCDICTDMYTTYKALFFWGGGGTPELQSPKIHVGEQIVHFLILLKCWKHNRNHYTQRFLTSINKKCVNKC